MCGIAGIYRPGGKPIETELIRKMTDSIAHRGPDGEDHYILNECGLAFGHRRLSIIDLSSAGKQPMQANDGNAVIIFNGEIYNFAELRAELQKSGHHFTSGTDTEVILRGYLQWGLDVIPKLNGMFAFALWDNSKKELILVRDRFGIKPLYIWNRGNEIVFASEVKAIMQHPDFKVQLDFEALNEYFTFQNVFRFHTLFAGVQMLAPGRVLRFDENCRLNEYLYWNYNFTDTDKNISEADAREETLRLFNQAVKRQMVADVRVGSYLSGGMDSGSITAVASKQTNRLATFTCGFDMSAATGREANFDERRDAELMASAFRTEHYEQVLNAADLGWALPRLVYHLEDLRVGMSYPNYYIAGLASKFVKVCLSGAGGDELYGGYPWRYYRVFKSINQEDYFKEYYSFWQRLVSDHDKVNLFTPDIYSKVNQVKSPYDIFRNVFLFNDKLKYDTPEDHIANSLYFEAKTFLPALFVVGDKLAMAHSLEERFPFMDNDLVDFAQKIPVKYKLGNLEAMKKMDENEIAKLRKFQMQFDDGKNVLRNAMNQLIPQEVLSRKKQGFSAPDESWYRGENLQYVKNLLLNKKTVSSEYIQPDFIKNIIDEHTNKNINHRLLIWSFINFEWWCRIFVGGEKVYE